MSVAHNGFLRNVRKVKVAQLFPWSLPTREDAAREAAHAPGSVRPNTGGCGKRLGRKRASIRGELRAAPRALPLVAPPLSFSTAF